MASIDDAAFVAAIKNAGTTHAKRMEPITFIFNEAALYRGPELAVPNMVPRSHGPLKRPSDESVVPDKKRT
jgi:hypothetical protein